MMYYSKMKIKKVFTTKMFYSGKKLFSDLTKNIDISCLNKMKIKKSFYNKMSEKLKEHVIGGMTWYQYGEDTNFLNSLENFKETKRKEFQCKDKTSPKKEEREKPWKRVKK